MCNFNHILGLIGQHFTRTPQKNGIMLRKFDKRLQRTKIEFILRCKVIYPQIPHTKMPHKRENVTKRNVKY